ncbi:MAG: lipopolysaccharide biosynthesis protein [Clostridia bacterium]|nr:lipopolysaccharide biosynthesis protein [Clostridia bacterium]
MENKTVRSKVMSGLAWKFAERILAQFVTFVVSIILARLLSPEHYGTIAIVNIFIALANVFVVSGFGNSLIQKKDADDTDFSSVFYFNILLGTVLYGVVFLIAPFIASFYNMPILKPVLRVMGLRLIVASVNNVQHAYVSKKMMFRRFFWSTLGGTLASAVVGIVMAYNGFGVWALVGQYMTNTVTDTLVLWFTVRWRPKFLFSFKRLGALFSYGWKLLCSALLDTGYNELRSLVIGKMYTSADLAYYNKGKSFPNLIVTNINSSIQSVLFPAMANAQDKKEQVKAMVRRSIRISSYIMLPLMVGLALVAEPFVKLLLTKKWLPCVPYLRISCFVFAFMPIHTANLQAINAMGRSDIFLKLEIIKKITGLAILFLSMRHGVMAIALSGIMTTVISALVNAYPNRTLLRYNYMEQIKDLFSGIIPLLIMVIVVALLGQISVQPLLQILIQALTGAIVYIGTSFLTKNESFDYILSVAKGFLTGKRG